MNEQMKPKRVVWLALAVSTASLVIMASLVSATGGALLFSYMASWAVGKALIEIILSALDSIGKEISKGLGSILPLVFYLLTHPALNNPNVSAGPYLQLSGAIMSIIIPVIAFAILLASGKMVLASENPGERAAAKGQLHNLLVGLVIIPFSPHLYKLVLDVNHMLTVQLLGSKGAPGIYQSMVKGESLSSALYGAFSIGNPGQYCIILMIAYAVSILAIGMILLRHILIVLFAVLMPLTCFLYLFDFTKTLGRKFLKYSITWAFVPVAMSVWIIIAGLVMVNIGNGVDRNNGVFLAIVFLGGIIMSPLIITGALETMGAAITAIGQLQGGAIGTGMVAAGQLMQAQSGEALMMASLNAASKAAMGGMKGISSGVKSLAGGATGQGGSDIMGGNIMGASGQGSGLSSAAGQSVETAGNAIGQGVETAGQAGGQAMQSAGQAGLQGSIAATVGTAGIATPVTLPAAAGSAGAMAGGAGVQVSTKIAGQSIKAVSKVAGQLIKKVGGAAEKMAMKGLKQVGGKAAKGAMGAAGSVGSMVGSQLKKGFTEKGEGEQGGMSGQVSSALKSAKGGKSAGRGLYGKLRGADSALGKLVRDKTGVTAAGAKIGGAIGKLTAPVKDAYKGGMNAATAATRSVAQTAVDTLSKTRLGQTTIGKTMAETATKSIKGMTATGAATNVLGGMMKGGLATTLMGVATLGATGGLAGILPAVVGLAIGGYALMKGTGLGRGIGNTIKASTRGSAFFQGFASKGLVNTASALKSLPTGKGAFVMGKLAGAGLSFGLLATGWLALRAPLLGAEFAMSGGMSLPIRAGRSLWKAPGAISKGVGTLREAYNTYKDTSTPEPGKGPAKDAAGASGASGTAAGAAPVGPAAGGQEAAKDMQPPVIAAAQTGGQQEGGGEKPAETPSEPAKESAGAAGQKAEPAAGAQKAEEGKTEEPGKSGEEKAKEAEKEKPKPDKERSEREAEHEKYEKLKELMTGSFKGHGKEKAKGIGEQLEEMLNDGD